MFATFRPIDAILPRAAAAFGGKADNLASLTRSGFAVPRCYALPCAAAHAHYERVLPARLRPASLFQNRVVSDSALADARQLVLSGRLASEVVDSLADGLAELAKAGVVGVAVRSSSPTEDHQLAAVAGLHDSLLQVRGEAEAHDAIRRCWASVFSPQVLPHMQRDVERSGAGVGVILQAMLPAEVSGLMYTVNPLTGDASEIVINAAYGLGTVVTEGAVTPDTYRIDKDSGWVRDRVVGSKRFREDPLATGGTFRTEVSEALTGRLSLPEHHLGQLVDLSRRIEAHFGGPRDIEWSVAQDCIYLLQARPAIAMGQKASVRAKHRKAREGVPDPVDTVWSKVHLNDSAIGVATPLTWSVYSAVEKLGLEQMFHSLGCSATKHDRLVANFRGRSFLNLSEFSRILAQVPGLHPGVVFPMAGQQAVGRLQQDMPDVGRIGFMLRLPRTATRLTRQHVRLQRRVDKFERGFFSELRRVQALDLRILPGAALDATLSDVCRLLNDTSALALTVYSGLLATVLPLRGALAMAFAEDASWIEQGLFSAVNGIESAEPILALIALSQIAREDVSLEAFIDGDAELTSEIDLPPGKTRTGLEAFLRSYGHHAIRQGELASPRWREQPQVLIQALRLCIRAQGAPDLLPALAGRAKDNLTRAQDKLLDAPLPLRHGLRSLSSAGRHYMRLYERMGSRVSQALDLLRTAVMDIERRLRVREPDCGVDAAFYLQLTELHSLLRGEISSVVPLLQRRRAQYEREVKLPPPPGTFVGYPGPSDSVAASVNVLNGVPAAPGEGAGRVVLLSELSDGTEVCLGDILVLSAADPGFSPLFCAASALVFEEGGPLSHACVLAREFGVPTVVNVSNATQRLKTGDRVVVRGDLGTVHVL